MQYSDLDKILYSIRVAITLTIPDLLAIISASVVLGLLTGIYAKAGSIDFITMVIYAAFMLATSLWPSLIIALTYTPVILLIYRGFSELDAAVKLKWGRIGSLILTAAYLLWVLNSILVTVTQPIFQPIASIESLINRIPRGSFLVIMPVYVSVIMAAAMVAGVVGVLMCSYSLIKVGRLIGSAKTVRNASIIITISIVVGIMPMVGVILLIIGLYLMLRGLKVMI
ncbi:hypothetical protein [Caldivirga maquilingensis]|uniref:Uncharacterized protein n=1 Tax=Caldivirga maquilingensis (strain ATCC 700844 / DSM 13496 / JCM 10307 / IC-167) TaxID=397948 RepID=A8MD90_CALMQ|nr:hypothetical protein [Caldivirga maquilingensis]ABW01746.1 hypothetical protein Cmaq_0913 [Caldivirga maquilingensis IC-167]